MEFPYQELAVIVDVQESDEDYIEAAIGMHRWQHYLTRCPHNWQDETSHIYRCVSTSIEHLERSLGGHSIRSSATLYTYHNELPLGFTEYLGIDPASLGPRQLMTDGTFVHPCPAPSLPDNDRWPPRQSGLTLYIRPKAPLGTKLAPSGEVDEFLSSIALAQANSEDTVIEPSHGSATLVKSESDGEDQLTLGNTETSAVKLEALEPADTAERAIQLHTENESLDPLEGFDDETRSEDFYIGRLEAHSSQGFVSLTLASYYKAGCWQYCRV
jgi:hypothetical protein